ncbi:MAG: redoxin domain-containing protein [Flavobacteriales bacterium]|nr:redoxin domain-containing protein [Flavobacteriales bacterium]
MRKGFFLLLILLFPSIIYLLFSLGKHHVEKIRSFGSYTVNQEGDTTYAPVPDLIFMDHSGSVVHLDDLRGKPIVLDLFPFPCDDPCRKKGVTLVNYLNELPEREKWIVLSLSMKTEVDPADLHELQQAHLPEMTNWYFAAAEDEEELSRFLDYVFVETGRIGKVDDLPGKDFALIDQQGVIRAYFDSRIHKENRKLEDAVKLLLQEPFLTWREKDKK